MSRIGKKPIEIPAGVQAQIQGQKISVQGPKGTLNLEAHTNLKLKLEDSLISVIPARMDSQGRIEKDTRALWGLTRALIANMVKGVVSGYEKKLEIEGVGYKAALEGATLVLNVGFTHSIKIVPPQGIVFSVDKNVIAVNGIDKGLVGEMAAQVRAARPVEPYKGKGIKYVGEFVRRKAGKKTTTSAGA
ncbi:MAG: 50S ribosomal protein L6 [Candidatus Wildermuthbacteria bacterium]|nr:50S ribosomal protein L6 [Candidatus Wildermuthbacteria bacterium]